MNKSGKVSGEPGAGSSGTFEEKAFHDINEAYALFLQINVLDISKEGQDLWDATKSNYDNKIDKVE